MARIGISKSEVQKARNSILAMNQYPSVDRVREALGNTGSKSTIHRHLKDIVSNESQTTCEQNDNHNAENADLTNIRDRVAALEHSLSELFVRFNDASDSADNTPEAISNYLEETRNNQNETQKILQKFEARLSTLEKAAEQSMQRATRSAFYFEQLQKARKKFASDIKSNEEKALEQAMRVQHVESTLYQMLNALQEVRLSVSKLELNAE